MLRPNSFSRRGDRCSTGCIFSILAYTLQQLAYPPASMRLISSDATISSGAEIGSPLRLFFGRPRSARNLISAARSSSFVSPTCMAEAFTAAARFSISKTLSTLDLCERWAPHCNGQDQFSGPLVRTPDDFVRRPERRSTTNGRSSARRVRGYAVVTCGRDARKLSQPIAEYPAVESQAADVSDAAAMRAFASDVRRRDCHPSQRG